MPALCRRVSPLLLACWCALSAMAIAPVARGQTSRGNLSRSNELNPSAGPLSVQVEPALPLAPELLGARYRHDDQTAIIRFYNPE